MTLRRVFSTADGGQILVTVEADGDVHVATRAESWHTWDAPLVFDYADDDPSDQ